MPRQPILLAAPRTSTATDGELVTGARNGQRKALEELVGRHLPLVYGIVGRAVPGQPDVDDVVQDTMLNALRGLPRLRDDQAFRSWLVAVAMNQIRKHRHRRSARFRSLDELAAVADPAAEFADLLVTRLSVSGQRQEIVEAIGWLSEDDQELLSMWWLVTIGRMTRQQLVEVLGMNPHTVTVRVGRMKSQTDTARTVVRALGAVPRCAELVTCVRLWDGTPSGLWRKRLARHVRGCGQCGGLAADLIATERLLALFALAPVPVDTWAEVRRSSAA